MSSRAHLSATAAKEEEGERSRDLRPNAIECLLESTSLRRSSRPKVCRRLIWGVLRLKGRRQSSNLNLRCPRVLSGDELLALSRSAARCVNRCGEERTPGKAGLLTGLHGPDRTRRSACSPAQVSPVATTSRHSVLLFTYPAESRRALLVVISGVRMMLNCWLSRSFEGFYRLQVPCWPLTFALEAQKRRVFFFPRGKPADFQFGLPAHK